MRSESILQKSSKRDYTLMVAFTEMKELSKFVLVVNLILLLGLAVSVTSATERSNRADISVHNVSSVTFISTQGGSAILYPHAGSIKAIHTPSKEIIWKHDRYRRYMDIDPLNNSAILFVAGNKTETGLKRIAVIYNWREDKELFKFSVPRDTHDVDKYSENSFVVADKANGRIYIYNRTTRSVSWKYKFLNHFPRTAGGPCCGHEYTHLNDVEVLKNGSAFLVSPRNFDRVFLINKTDKSVIWELGEEDNYSILYEQHNPDVLTINPPTVLVSDSENDRVVEYSRENGSWKSQWQYSGGLNWPRDADRLASGNTIITDTVNGRVIEVTPSGKIVWSYNTGRGPYDAERLSGDESVRKPVENGLQAASSKSLVHEIFENLYSRVGVWVLPEGTGKPVFAVFLFVLFIDISYLVKFLWGRYLSPSIYESSSRNSN